MSVSFSHVSHAVYIFAFVDSSSETTLQCVSVSPVNIHLGQTHSLGPKVWGGTKHF